MTDYAVLLDDEVRAFIARTDAFYPPDAVTRSIAEQRRIYDEMCAEFRQPRPDTVEVRNEYSPGDVPCRIYEAGAPDVTVIYLHGGGMVVGGLDSHDDICAEICAQTGFRVVSVDYRLCPEHIHPAAFDDAWAVTQWVAQTWGAPILLVGDSAGGTLAASVAHHARGKLKGIRGQILIYPALSGTLDTASAQAHANAPGLTVADMQFYSGLRAGGTPPTDDPTYLALQDNDFTGLPSTVIITAECDPLSDDGMLYRDAILEAGGRAYWLAEPGLIHGYLRARTMSARARDSFDRIITAIQCLGQGLWPYD